MGAMKDLRNITSLVLDNPRHLCVVSFAPKAEASQAPRDGQLHMECGQEEAGFLEERRGLGTGRAVCPRLARAAQTVWAAGIMAFLLSRSQRRFLCVSPLVPHSRMTGKVNIEGPRPEDRITGGPTRWPRARACHPVTQTGPRGSHHSLSQAF